MVSFERAARLVALAAMFVIAAGVGRAQAPEVGVSLKVSREIAPPGRIAQMKVFVTEPKPITTGRAWMEFDAFSDIVGIALGAEDSAAVAVVVAGQLEFSVVSPGGAFGMDPDYPVLTIAGRVPVDTPVGVRIPMIIDAASVQLTDPLGVLYPTHVKNGYLECGGTLSVSDVIPGNADLPAGATVSIFGSGFRPDTRVQLKETLLAGVMYVNPGRIDAVLGEPARMRGMGVRVWDRDGSMATYVSYQRTGLVGSSAHPVLQHVVPVFPAATSQQASIRLGTATAGIALQNLGAVDVSVFAELADASGVPLAVGFIDVPSSKYVVQAISETFGVTHAGPGFVRIVAASPVQVLGVDVDAAGRATPRLPQ